MEESYLDYLAVNRSIIMEVGVVHLYVASVLNNDSCSLGIRPTNIHQRHKLHIPRFGSVQHNMRTSVPIEHYHKRLHKIFPNSYNVL